MPTHLEFPPRPSNLPRKLEFDLDEVLHRLEDRALELPPPLHTALFDEGYQSVFHHVVISLISARTADEATKTAARQLFRWAPDEAAVHRLSHAQVEALLAAVAFPGPKAERLKEIARVAVEKYGGTLPGRERVLRALPGIGATCANLVLGLVCEQDKLCVGQHVMRITKRWGLVTATSASGIESQLSQALPREIWREFGEWCVAFGDHVCTRRTPQCRSCPLVMYCRQVGLTIA